MSDYSNILKKIYQSEIFENDGFVYNIVDVKKLEDWAESYSISFDVELPKKGQSYLLAKLDDDVRDIIDFSQQILDTQFSFSIGITVDGQKAKEIFLSKELVTEIIISLKTNFTKFRTEDDNFEADIKVLPKIDKNLENKFYSFSYNSINFFFKVDVLNYQSNENLKFNDKNELMEFLHHELHEAENFRSLMEEDIYGILTPELKMDYTDVFITCAYEIGTLPEKI